MSRLMLVLLAASAGCLADDYDADRALAFSQAAVGRAIGNYELTSSTNDTVRVSDFAGKPLVISMIFTSCHHVCPVTTKHLDQSIAAARDALGDGAFEVLTIGFDSANDTPAAMQAFAREQGVDAPDWHFLSASPEVVRDLSADLGFSYFPAPRGFDHINQTSIVDRNGVVYAQVYGVKFELPWLVEPLKELVFNRPGTANHFASRLVDRVRLFCTVYDPATGRYEFDRSIFFQAAAGIVVILAVIVFLWQGFRSAKPGI